MPVAKSQKVGPGTFTVGTGTSMDLSCQMTSLAVEPNEEVSREDPVPVLCGGELPASETVSYSATLEGNILQDYTPGGCVFYTYQHAGEEMPFTYVPNSAYELAMRGTVRIAPITVGGDVTKRGTSDIKWTCIGLPMPEDTTP